MPIIDQTGQVLLTLPASVSFIRLFHLVLGWFEIQKFVTRHACACAYWTAESGSLSIRLSKMFGSLLFRWLSSFTRVRVTKCWIALWIGTAGIQLEDDVLVCFVCFTGTLDNAIMFSLEIGTNSVSEFETTPARIPSAGIICACMCACGCVPNKMLHLVVALALHYIALPYHDELASPVSSRGGRPPSPAM